METERAKSVEEIQSLLLEHLAGFPEKTTEFSSFFGLKRVTSSLELAAVAAKAKGQGISAGKGGKDIVPREYEGGYKVWESEGDAVRFLENSGWFCAGLNGKRVLEIGCGSGLIGIVCLKMGCRDAIFQDFNQDVLDFHTRINVAINGKDLLERSRFCQADWTSFSENREFLDSIGHEGVDLIFGADVLYETRNYPSLLELFSKSLRPNGQVLIFTKSVYFGNTGNSADFEEAVAQDGRFECQEIECPWVGQGKNKEVLALSFKKK